MRISCPEGNQFVPLSRISDYTQGDDALASPGADPKHWAVSVNDKSRRPALLPIYEQFLADSRTADLIAAVSSRYTVCTLYRLTEHPLREVRRAAVLAVDYLGDYTANAAIGRRLTDVDRQVRTLAEHAIRHLWLRDGEPAQREALAAVVRLNQNDRAAEAAAVATELIRLAPWFAEAWNQRALAYHNLGRWSKAIADCHQALELNPYHFAAAAGMGQCYLKLNRRAKALECLRRALKLNPDMMGVRACVQYLQRVVDDE